MGTFDQNFNPFSNLDFPMTQVAIYESMLVYNPADGTTTPWLATSWDAAADGTGITYHLREGVKWSDGEPLIAQDVVTSFALQKEIRGGFDYIDTVTAVTNPDPVGTGPYTDVPSGRRPALALLTGSILHSLSDRWYCAGSS